MLHFKQNLCEQAFLLYKQLRILLVLQYAKFLVMLLQNILKSVSVFLRGRSFVVIKKHKKASVTDSWCEVPWPNDRVNQWEQPACPCLLPISSCPKQLLLLPGKRKKLKNLFWEVSWPLEPFGRGFSQSREAKWVHDLGSMFADTWNVTQPTACC